MARLVADTHALIWYLETSPRLSPSAHAAIKAAFQAGESVLVPTVSLVEIAYLVEKGRLPADTFERVIQVLRLPNGGFEAISFTLEMAEALRLIPAGLVPDMPDRMIAATALNLGLPLVTCDTKIRSAPLVTLW